MGHNGDVMKRVLASAALLALSASPAALFTCLAAPAMAATTLWQGDLFITAVNNVTACDAVNMQVAHFARFNFQPKSVAGNGVSDLLSWTFSRSSGQMTPGGGVLNTATRATVRYVFGSAKFSQIANSPIDATVSPAAPTGATATVLMTVRINNIYSSSGAALSGCNATVLRCAHEAPGVG